LQEILFEYPAEYDLPGNISKSKEGKQAMTEEERADLCRDISNVPELGGEVVIVSVSK